MNRHEYAQHCSGTLFGLIGHIDDEKWAARMQVDQLVNPFLDIYSFLFVGAAPRARPPRQHARPPPRGRRSPRRVTHTIWRRLTFLPDVGRGRCASGERGANGVRADAGDG
eukprot:gene7019-15969_t